jgi:AGZA family xanthine/uracil permease-like MFS transporter
MLRDVDWSDAASAAPAFLCAIVMPFTWSISNGIGAGVIAHVVLAAFAGRARDVHPLLWGVAAAFVAFFALT